MQNLGDQVSPVLPDLGHEAQGLRQDTSREEVQEELCQSPIKARQVLANQAQSGEEDTRR